MPDAARPGRETPPISDTDARLVTRCMPAARRRRLASAVRADRMTQIDSLELLAPADLRALAIRSFWLLMLGIAGFLALGAAARATQHTGPLPGAGTPALAVTMLLLANVGSYIVMVPLHEGLHAAVIVTLGGRPRFGLRLPLAAYCTAPGQLFTRDGYIVVALAPLVALTVAGGVLTWLAPNAGAYVLLGLAGNISGAVGDLVAAKRLRSLPRSALIADTETGYVAYMPAME